MSDIRTGRLIRELRRRRRLRQRDLAELAGVSQQAVSLVERGRLAALTVATVRAVGACLDVELPFEARYRGALGDRLLDARHAELVDTVAARLEVGWEVVVEYGFNHYGERGSVDILAWNPHLRALLIIEIKTELADIQEMLRSLDRKQRIVPGLVARERGWRPASVGVLVVLPGTSTSHGAVARHSSLFDVALPVRTVAVRRWMSEPRGDVRGIWFVHATNRAGAKSEPPTPHRVRGRSGSSDSVASRSGRAGSQASERGGRRQTARNRLSTNDGQPHGETGGAGGGP